jgi:hypothetical protein
MLSLISMTSTAYPFGLAGSAGFLQAPLWAERHAVVKRLAPAGIAKERQSASSWMTLDRLEVDYPNLSKAGVFVFASRFCGFWRVSLACDWIIAFPIHDDADPYQGGSDADAPNQKEADGGQSVAAHFTVPSRAVA